MRFAALAQRPAGTRLLLVFKSVVFDHIHRSGTCTTEPSRVTNTVLSVMQVYK